jgi:hypothetical protein
MNVSAYQPRRCPYTRRLIASPEALDTGIVAVRMRVVKRCAMSALGHKQTFAVQNVMSALPPIATAKSGYLRFVMSALPPKTDMCGATRLFNPKGVVIKVSGSAVGLKPLSV